MSNATAVVRLAAQLGRDRANTWATGQLRRDPLARLRLRAGRVNPYPIYERLRATGPLTRARTGEWVTTNHHICSQVLRDRHFGVRSPDDPMPVPGAELDLSMLDRNPPDHTRLRRLAMPAFSPKAIGGYRTRVEKVAHGLLDKAEQRSQFDLIGDFAAPLPIAVITELLGIPDADVDDFSRYGAVVGSALDGVRSIRHAKALMLADRDLQRIFTELIEKRTVEPGDDVISHLVGVLDEKLTSYEMVNMCRLLLIAGFETTVNLIGNGTNQLLDHPDQWALLRDDHELSPSLVEEVLRFDPPVQRTARVALEPIELDERQLVRNDWVITLLGAANRDPDVFADPNRFDITRKSASEHLAFSGGIHYCLGAPLARLEGAVAFRTLAQRLPHLRRAGRIVRRQSITIRGLSRLPVTS